MLFLREMVEAPEILTEQTSSGKVLYLEGPMLQAVTKNRNGRIYPKDVMEKAVEEYKTEYIDQSRAIGELNHPNRPFADPRQAALFIESLSWQGDLVVGKARILDTPDGDIIKALVEAGFKGGVSSRGLGDLTERNGEKYVSNYMLNCIDYVDKPSGQSCYPNAIMEASQQWVMKNGIWQQDEQIDLQLAQSMFLEKFQELLENMKGRK